MRPPASTIVFDLDGVLSDPSVGFSASISHALETCGFGTVTREQVIGLIGPPLDEIFRAFAGEAADPVMDELVAAYRERYIEVGFSQNDVYPGIPAALERLFAAGRPMGVCTSKRADYATKIVELHGLMQHFRFLSGGDIGVSKAMQLERLLAQGDIDRDAVMVGDREVDVYAAQANGLRSIGVLWGFGDRAELEAAGPDEIVGSVQELEAMLV